MCTMLTNINNGTTKRRARERERARHRKEIAKQNKIDKKTHATHTHKDAMEIVAGRPFADFSPA